MTKGIKAGVESQDDLSVPLICTPDEIDGLSRRQFLRAGCCVVGYLALDRMLFPDLRGGTIPDYPLQRKLIWINMNGGWDILEVMDPKPASTSGIDMIYDYSLANRVSGAADDVRLGRWMPRMAGIGDDLLLVKGISMGTTSHTAGSIYMDTGILSNAGRVNSASIPTIVASESKATIPIIQLAGGSDPMTDRGVVKPVSVVRAQNLELYRSLYPGTSAAIERQTAVLDYVKSSLTRLRDEVSPGDQKNDRLDTISAAEDKIRRQFADNVGSKLALTASDRAAFTTGAPRGIGTQMTDSFALASKLVTNDICDVINLGIGGFDTHSGQSARLQPILEGVDFLVKNLVDQLQASNQLDKTLIVMYSDFGRTPKINGSNGRDHWPVGGALMIGGGIKGARIVGDTDSNFRALDIDPDAGTVLSTGGTQLNPTHIGGSVLQLTLGSGYLQYRNYLSAIGALTLLK